MAAFGRASVVLVEFPFSDLSKTKLRPAVVLAQANQQDWFLCQITSNAGIDDKAIEIKRHRFCYRLSAAEELCATRQDFHGS